MGEFSAATATAAVMATAQGIAKKKYTLFDL